MNLFKYDKYKVEVSPEALLLNPFKEIWKRDKSKNKEKAMQELAFIYFYCDIRSDYQYITNDEDRLEKIKEDEGFPKTWKPDSLILKGVDFYNSFKSTAELLLEDTRYAVDKLRLLLKNIDLNQVDDKGRPIYTLNTITSTIKQVPSLVKDLDEAEKTIAKELLNNSKMRGSGEKTLMEDSLDI